MTRDIDIERVLDRFYADGPSEMPDRVFLGVVDRIERVPQRRLAYQMTRFATMNSNLRLAAAAAIVVAVVGVTAFAISRGPDIGNQPTPNPSTTTNPSTPTFEPASLPAALQSRWVGAPRIVPQAPEPPARIGLRISGGDLQFHLPWTAPQPNLTQFASTAVLIGPSQIRLRLATTDGGCQPQDEGTYDFTLSPDSTVLTLTPVADQCQPRTAALAGDWIRAACPEPNQQAWCLGNLAPGTHVSTQFTPLVPPINGQDSYSYGALSYTVPTGWANMDDDNIGYVLARQDAPVNTGIWVWSDVVPHSQADMCSSTPEPGVGRDSAAFAAWLTTLPGLITTAPVPVTISGLSGLMVDLSVAPTWTASCPYAYTAGLPLVSTYSSPTAGGVDWNIQGEGRTRIILLDIGDGRALLIDIEAQNKADYDALLPEAMQVVNSFVFNQ